MTTNEWKVKSGAECLEEGAYFSVWAPFAKHVDVKILGAFTKVHALKALQMGFYEGFVSGVAPGKDYLFILDGQLERPDPASRWQPHGVHGPSRLYKRDAFKWEDGAWKGLELKDYLFYEIHTGTFTPEGTFEGIIHKLPYLKSLGVTAIEVMPIAQFPGSRNWGYDGVYPYAVQDSYGGPDGFKKLVNACHLSGMAVVLDVVYNHLGPEGNYLGDFGPYFTHRYQTPWGQAINLDGPYSDFVKHFFIENALFWLSEYHVDALRIDAVHAIFDQSAYHFLAELAHDFHAEAERLGRKAYLVAESDLSDVRVINTPQKGGYGIDAQWNDDFHHSQHTLLSGRRNGYFVDFGSVKCLEKSIKEGFVHDGVWSPFRKRRHGSPSKENPGTQFVICTQNHDQIGNGARGERCGHYLSLEQQKVAAALLLCGAPNLPLLFMGQEFGVTSPFYYFTSHEDPVLVENIRTGYQQEWAAFGFPGEAINPQDEAVFRASKMNWSEENESSHRELFQFYRDCIQWRRICPALSNGRKDLLHLESSEEERWLTILREDTSPSKAYLVVNLQGHSQNIPTFFPSGKWVLTGNSEAAKYGGQEIYKEEVPQTLEFVCPQRLTLKVPAWCALLFTAKE